MDKPVVKVNECPRCAKQTRPEGVSSWAWPETHEPCPDVADCFKVLRERIERLERALENHNFL